MYGMHEWNNSIAMKCSKMFNLSAGATNKFPLRWLLTRAQCQNRNLGIVLLFFLLFNKELRVWTLYSFFLLFFLLMLLFGNFRPVFVRKQIAVVLSISNQPFNQHWMWQMQHAIIYPLTNVRDLLDFRYIVKKEHFYNKDKRKCFKTINSSRLFPVCVRLWFFSLQFISRSIFGCCCRTMFNTLAKVIYSRYDFILSYGQWNTKYACARHRLGFRPFFVCWISKSLRLNWFIRLDVLHSCQKKTVFDFHDKDFWRAELNHFEPQQMTVKLLMLDLNLSKQTEQERHLFFGIFFLSSYSVFLSRILPGIFLSIILFSYNYDQFHKFHAIHNTIRLLSSLCFSIYLWF